MEDGVTWRIGGAWYIKVDLEGNRLHLAWGWVPITLASVLEAEAYLQFPLACVSGISGTHSSDRLNNQPYGIFNNVRSYLTITWGDVTKPVLPWEALRMGTGSMYKKSSVPMATADHFSQCPLVVPWKQVPLAGSTVAIVSSVGRLFPCEKLVRRQQDCRRRSHRWELIVLHYHKILVIYPYPFVVVITRLLSWIIFINYCICILTCSSRSYFLMIVYGIRKIRGNENSPNYRNAMVNYYYHGENRLITQNLPDMIGFR